MTDLFAHADAKALRDGGLVIVEAHGPGFAAAAYEAIQSIAASQASVHIDDVLACGLPQPHHPNAWGAVWMRAIRAGLIERTDETRACTRDPKKHAHRYPVYRSLAFQVADSAGLKSRAGRSEQGGQSIDPSPPARAGLHEFSVGRSQ